jgi:hypothetical protein
MKKWFYATLKKAKGKRELGSKCGPMDLKRYTEMVEKGFIDDEYNMLSPSIKKETPKTKVKEDDNKNSINKKSN